MPKLSLTDLASLTNETSAIAAINNNNTLVENALENTLSRDGTSPNSMNSNLDMNSYRIQNLPIPIGGTEPIRKNEFDETLAGIQASQVTNGSVPTPVLENVGKYLKATGIGNYTWSDVAGSGAVSLTNYNETAVTAKTTFTITGGYTSTSVFVYLNGVLLEPSEYVASNGTTVVLNSVCAIGDEFRCISFAPFAAITLGALAAKNTVAAADIDAGAVSYAKIQNVTQGRVLGRTAGAVAGGVQELPIAVDTSGNVGISGALSIPVTKGLVVDGSTNAGASSKYIGGAGGMFGTNNSMVFNVPSAMGFEFAINNVTQGSINTSGIFSCKLTQSAAGNGYVRLPSGILIQWGVASASTGGTISNFPIAFPGTCWSIVAVNKNQTNPPAPSVEVVSASQFTLTTSAGSPNCNFIAIGN